MLFLDSVHLCTLMSVTAAAAAVNQVAATVRRAGQCVSARASEICGSLIAVRGGNGQGMGLSIYGRRVGIGERVTMH